MRFEISNDGKNYIVKVFTKYPHWGEDGRWSNSEFVKETFYVRIEDTSAFRKISVYLEKMEKNK